MPELAARLLAASYFFMGVNMRKFILSVLLFFIVFNFCDVSQVYANSEPNKSDMYIDGYPRPGVVAGSSNVTIYHIPVTGDPYSIGFLEPGKEVTLLALVVLNNSTNYFYIEYENGVSQNAYILFDDIQPVGAVITPAPGSFLEFNDYDVSAFYEVIRDFINDVITFFTSLPNLLLVLFPFFTVDQIQFLITFIVIFLGVGLCLLFRKVFI